MQGVMSKGVYARILKITTAANKDQKVPYPKSDSVEGTTTRSRRIGDFHVGRNSKMGAWEWKRRDTRAKLRIEMNAWE